MHVLYVCRLDLQLPLLQNALADANAYAAAGHGVGFLGPVVSQNTFGVLRGMQARNAARQQRNPNAAAARVDADQRALEREVDAQLDRFRADSDDLALYFDIPDPSTGKTVRRYSDPLLWWKANEKTYPLIAAAARRLLAVPASEAPSERVFSRLSNLVPPERNRLSTQRVIDSLLLHCNRLWLNQKPENA